MSDWNWRYFTLTVLLYTKKNSQTKNPVVVNYRKFCWVILYSVRQ